MQTFHFLGKSQGGVLFDVMVVIVAIVRLYQKHCWVAIKARLWESIFEGVTIALLAGIVVFAFEFVYPPPKKMQSALQAATIKE